MRIDGLNSSESSYGIYNRIPSAVSFLSGKNAAEEKFTTENGGNSSEKEIDKVNRANADIKDVSVSFGNRDQSLVGLGNIGGIQSNIMRQAVNDMQKDSLLHEYQYFVGNGAVSNTADALQNESKVILNDEDGVVIRNNK